MYIVDGLEVRYILLDKKAILQASNSIRYKMMALFLHYDAHVHIKKPHGLKKWIGAIIAIIVAVITGPQGGWAAYLAIAAAVATVAVTLTGSETWGRILKLVNTAQTMMSITSGLKNTRGGMKAGMWKTMTKNWGRLIQVASKASGKYQQKRLAKDKRAATNLQDKIDGEIRYAQDNERKIKNFVYGGWDTEEGFYSEPYNYDKLYNTYDY